MDYQPANERLTALEERARREIEITNFPKRVWLIPREHEGRHVHDVAIIGAGQAGISIAFALKRRAIVDTVLLDEARQGREGSWMNYARMRTLRTPKHVAGPDQGIPSLTCEAWYRAAYGDDAWNGITFIPREHWHQYLVWMRRVTEPDVRNETRVDEIRPVSDYLELDYTDASGPGSLLARRVVLATGIAGNGEWAIPSLIKDTVPREKYIDTGSQIDFTRFRGQRIGTLGGGASAFDYSAEALENGAKSVDLFFRRTEIPRMNPFRWMEFYGYPGFYADLPDEDKWKFAEQFRRTNQPPPQATWYRATRWDEFNWHTGAGWREIRMDGEEIVVGTGVGEFRFDAIICGTGPNIDFSARPELAPLEPLVAFWRDRFTPPPGWEDPVLLDYPYLGDDFRLLPKHQGEAPWVERIYDFTYGAWTSMGLAGNMTSGLKIGGARLTDGISRSIFLEDRDRYLDDYLHFDGIELADMGRPPKDL